MAPRRTRATVTCARSGRALGAPVRGARERGDEPFVQAGELSRGIGDRGRQHMRATRGEPQRPADVDPHRAGCASTGARRRAQRVELADRALPEERERHVQCCGGDGPQRRIGGGRRGTPVGQRIARARRQVGGREQPRRRGVHGASGSPSPSRTRRSRCSATVVVRSRTSARFPGRFTLRSMRAPPRSATDSQTRPTGLSCEPPPGPAIPVMAIPTSAPRRSAAPSASARATSSETAPCAAISSSGTPASSVFAAFE